MNNLKLDAILPKQAKHTVLLKKEHLISAEIQQGDFHTCTQTISQIRRF